MAEDHGAWGAHVVPIYAAIASYHQSSEGDVVDSMSTASTALDNIDPWGNLSNLSTRVLFVYVCFTHILTSNPFLPRCFIWCGCQPMGK